MRKTVVIDFDERIWYAPYPSSPVTDPSGPEEGADRVVRGGSWYSYARQCRSGERGSSLPNVAGEIPGFRLVMEPF